MKNVRKILIVLLLLVVCAASFPISANAAEAGTTIANAINATYGTTYTKGWTSSNYKLNHYVKFVVSQQGVVTFTITKPVDSEGEYGELHATIYDSNGNPLWDNKLMDVDAKTTYTRNVGLAAGTYYLNITPTFYVSSGTIKSDYKLTFKANSYCEVEPNGSTSLATTIKLGKKYIGWHGSCYGTYETNDYFKFTTEKDHYYRIVWYDYDTLYATTTLVKLFRPGGNAATIGGSVGYLTNFVNSEGLNYYDLHSSEAGVLYIQIHNYSGTPFEYSFIITDVTDEWSGGHTCTWNSGVVTKPATCSSTGIRTYTCTGCGDTKTETIAKTNNHNYSSAWNSNSSGHWHVCSTCGAKSTTESHIAGAAPTATTAQTCTVCGYKLADALGTAVTTKPNSATTTTTKPSPTSKPSSAATEKPIEDTTTATQPLDTTTSTTVLTEDATTTTPTTELTENATTTISSEAQSAGNNNTIIWIVACVAGVIVVVVIAGAAVIISKNKKK